MQTMYYIGLDVHKRTIRYCLKDGSGLKTPPQPQPAGAADGADEEQDQHLVARAAG